MPAELYIPLIWLLIYSSRPVASWFGAGGRSDLEGNIIDAVIVFGLICAAFVVLMRRQFQWSRLLSLHVAFFALLIYFAVSILWAPYPFVAFKRWFKEFGQVLVIMVILTQPDPVAAIKMIVLRCAAVLLPLSIVLIKYFGEFGRNYSYGGFQMVTGVTTQKNSLGQICAVYGLFLLWDILDIVRDRPAGGLLKALSSRLILFGMALTLLFQSQSKTALLAFIVGALVLLSTRLTLVRFAPRAFARTTLVLVTAGLIVTPLWDKAAEPFLEAMGRDTSFTERTKIWESVLDEDIDPWFGCGFHSFWLARGESVWSNFVNFRPKSAHCGYLETYLDGGYIGLALLILFLFVTSWRGAAGFSHENSFARVFFATAMMALIMNFSETYVFRLGCLWFFTVMTGLALHKVGQPATDEQTFVPDSLAPQASH